MEFPLLAPHTRFAWRDDVTLALEDPASAEAGVRIANASPGLVRWLRRCNGATSRADLLQQAPDHGLTRAAAEQLLSDLHSIGLLARTGPRRTAELSQNSDTGPALRQDLEALALCGDDPDLVHERRQQYRVVIDGSDRVAHALIEMLAAAHIGELSLASRHASRRILTLRDIAPFGPTSADVGTSGVSSMLRHIERRTSPSEKVARKTVVLLCNAQHDAAEELPLQLAGTPYLRIIASSRFATIGPLTLPGHSACGTCLGLHRSDHDHLWPRTIAQFDHHRRLPAPIDSPFAFAVASDAAQRLLRVVDTGDPSQLANTTWHIDRTDARLVRRRWPQHPECTCHAEAGVA